MPSQRKRTFYFTGPLLPMADVGTGLGTTGGGSRQTLFRRRRAGGDLCALARPVVLWQPVDDSDRLQAQVDDLADEADDVPLWPALTVVGDKQVAEISSTPHAVCRPLVTAHGGVKLGVRAPLVARARRLTVGHFSSRRLCWRAGERRTSMSYGSTEH